MVKQNSKSGSGGFAARRIQEEAIFRLQLRRCKSRWPSCGALCIRDYVIAYFTRDTIDIRVTKAGIRTVSEDIRSRAKKIRTDWIELPLDTDEEIVLDLLLLSKRLNLLR